jgi:hypothetical protein
MPSTRVHLVEHILPIEQRPHLADRLIAYTRDDSADVLENRVGRAPFVPPVSLRTGKFVCDGVPNAVLAKAQNFSGGVRVLHIVDAGSDIDQRLEHRIFRHVFDAFAVDVNLAIVANGFQIFFTGSNHGAVPV